MCIPINKVFDLTEDHFHENGLGTCPATKHPSKNNREEYDKNNKGQHTDTENEKILRPEDHPEKNEFSFQYIEQEDWISIDLNKGKCKKNGQVKNAEPCP